MTTSHRLRIATRESPLALAQAGLIQQQLQTRYSNLKIELVTMKTTGDRFLEQSLAKVGGKGLFVKELELALTEQRADIAVHSMKDVPSELAPEYMIAAICAREEPWDVLVSRHQQTLQQLQQGAVVGTSSLRRVAQLHALRPDLQVKLLRGNVNSRLQKCADGSYDAIILAKAGLKRLNLEAHITQIFTADEFLPAVGQGALGIECRSDDQATQALLAEFNHQPTRVCVEAERQMNARLGGSCHVPVAGYAECNADGTVTLHGLVGHPSGQPVFKAQATLPLATSATLGEIVANQLLEQGAAELLAGINL